MVGVIPKEATKHFRMQYEYKRLEAIRRLLKEGDKVLDVGCGLGIYTSNPLSYLPVSITAIDVDPKTVDYANDRNQNSNLEFVVALGETFETDDKYDLIICSHILEHIEEPIKLLKNMGKLIKEGGLLYVAIPNGFGWFEMQNFLPRMLWRLSWGRKLIEKMIGGNYKDSLNREDWHINFFTVKRIKRILENSGWQVVGQINDEFLGGIVFDRILSLIPPLERWNVKVADRLPTQLVNDWMFVCKRK